MRNWLSWIIGFLICFGGFSLFLLVYALDEPSMWLPMVFGIAFYCLLSFAPRLGSQRRTGVSMLFMSISCLLWAVSSSLALNGQRAAVQSAFEMLFGVSAVIGLLVLIGGSPANPKPKLTPIVTLMFLGWLISYFSSAHGGATPMTDWVVRHLGLGRHAAEELILVLRKTIHFTFYGTVALTGLAAANRNGAVKNSAIAAALLTTLTFASFDEIRQSTQPDRTGSAWDVLLDMTGGAAALMMVLALSPSKNAGSPSTIRKSSKI